VSQLSPLSTKSERIEIRVRNGVLEAGVGLKPGQALAPWLANRREAIRLSEVFWRETGKYVDHLTLLEHEIVWARPLDETVPVTNVGLTPGGTLPLVSVVFTTGQTLEGRVALIKGQGISDFLGTSGPWPVLRDARLPDGRRLGDVVMSLSALRSVREIAGGADGASAQPNVGGPVHWLLSLARRVGRCPDQSLVLPPSTPALDVWWALCAAGRMEQDVIARMIAEQLRLPLAANVASDPAAQSAIPKELVQRFGVRALSDNGRQLVVATIDPMDANAEQALSFACNRRVGFAVATPDWLGLSAVSGDPETELESLLSKMPSLTTDLVQIEEELDPRGVTAGDVSSEPIIKLCNLVLREAVRQNASDVHLEPDSGRGLIRFRVDGVLRPYMHVPLAALSRVISRFKILGKLDIADRVRPQDGRVRVRIDGRALELRLSTVPTQDAEKAVIRIAGGVQEQTLSQLEVPAPELERLHQMLGHRDGIIIVTGPTGSGKTTTLYAALNELNTGRVNIMTVEDPIERALAGATQIQVDARRGVTFASALRAVLRQDPDVILIGEIRDLETAEIAVQAATTGHLVLATLHTTTAVGVIERLRDLGVDRTSLAGSLRGVVGQRLARRICVDCAGDGCSRCDDSGYRGRIPIMEVLTATSSFAELVGRGASFHELQRAALAEGMRTMHEVAAQRVAEGMTTGAEINRVIGDAGDESGRRSSAASPAMVDAEVIVGADGTVEAEIIELTAEDVVPDANPNLYFLTACILHFLNYCPFCNFQFELFLNPKLDD
jgi:type II secretory ATPase GspE/PulE/Tfp pilus assembly ATPase PilB-like protein